MNRDSGVMRGRRTTLGGRRQIRSALYMAALSASRHYPDMATYHRRLTEAGKAWKVSITAVMRKLIILLNTIVARGTPWEPRIA